MALGALLRVGAKYVSPSITRALSKAIDPVKKADARLIDKVNKRFVTPTPKIVGSRSASVKDKVKALDKAHAANYDDAKAVVRSSQMLGGAAVGITLTKLAHNKKPSVKSTIPIVGQHLSKPASKPASKPVQSFVSRPPATKAKPASKPTSKAPAKVKMAKATTVLGASQRGQDMLGRKFSKMNTGQINRLKGKSLSAYKKYLKSKSK